MSGPLASPSKVAVSHDGQRLAIADTGHDQVLVCLLDGLLLSAHTGLSGPQGVRFDGDGLVICDTGAERVVSTTGEVLADGVASPRDLARETNAWLVAEAGRHRIVRIRAWEHQTRPVAGSGTEGLVDGPWYKAQLAEPSGLARMDRGVVFVDAASGTLRLLDHSGHVITLVGQGSQLRRPLAVAAAGERVYLADTLNSLLHVWEGGALRSLPVRGLAEPGGLDVLPDGRLVVADTGNDRIVVADPTTGSVEPLVVDDSWVASPDGPPLQGRPGQAVAVPFAVYLADEELDSSRGPPVEVTIDPRPASLLAPGSNRWEVSDSRGTLEVRAGRAGSGLLLVETTARTRAGSRRQARLFRRRHRLSVSG